jgi:hypothetical protein
MNLKDLAYSMFGAYANSANISTIPVKKMLQGDSNVSYSGSSMNAKNSVKALSKFCNNQAKLFKTTLSTREDIFESIDVVRHLDIAQQILETVIDDAFNTFDYNEPFCVEYVGSAYEADYINDLIASFIKRFSLYELFRDIVDEFITYGEYYLETDCVKGNGIVAINDTVSVKSVVSVYENYDLLYHVATRKRASGSDIIQVDKDRLSHFVLDNRKIRTGSTDFTGVSEVPDIIRVGRSLFFPVLKLLQRYNLIDLANVAQDLKSSLMPPIINIGVPDQATPDQTIELIKKYEEYFQEMGDVIHGIDSSKEIQPSQILQLATQVKVVPSSPDGKGRFEKHALESTVNLNETQDRIIQRITKTIGVPNDEAGKTRFTIIKEESRYAKKLIDIHVSCSNGIRGLVLKDLRYRGIIIDPSNIEVKFKSIPNPDVEEDAEGMFHMASSVRDVLRTYSEACADIGFKVNPKAAKAYIDSMMARYPQLENMIILDFETESDIAATDSEIQDAEQEENLAPSEPEPVFVEPEATEKPSEPEPTEEN